MLNQGGLYAVDGTEEGRRTRLGFAIFISLTPPVSVWGSEVTRDGVAVITQTVNPR